MKKFNKLFALTACLSILLASCSIEKRTYMSGYHVTWKNGKNDVAAKKKVTATDDIESDIITIETVENEVAINSPIETETPVETISPKINNKENSSKEETTTEKTTIKELKKTVKEDLKTALNTHKAKTFSSNISDKKIVRKKAKKLAPSEITVDGILLIIITILIPFLGVYLYEGVTTRFWISLILTFLLWFPGLIYGLLVVTGTI